MESDRYKRGLDKLREIDGEQGERVVASLSDIAPDFATYLIETVKKLLDCAKRCAVHFFAAIQQLKMHAKLLMRR